MGLMFELELGRNEVFIMAPLYSFLNSKDGVKTKILISSGIDNT